MKYFRVRGQILRILQNFSRSTFFLTVIFVVIFSCQKSNTSIPDVSHIEISLNVERLEDEFAHCKTELQALEFMDKHPLMATFFFERPKQGDSLLIRNILAVTRTPSFDTLFDDCKKIRNKFSELQPSLEKSFAYVKYYYPDYVIPQVKTIVTGYGRDIFASDSLIVIGLEFFRGEKGKYPPPLPDFIRKRYTPDYIVPYCMTAVSEKFNKTDEQDHSLIADMVYYGKAYYFLSRVLPETPESRLIGYTKQELKSCEDNAEIIWAHFVEKNLFFEKNPSVTERYVSERPFTGEISADCPGRVGRWLGWQIVKRYMEKNPDITLPELMQETDAYKIFRLSGYKPSL